MGKSVINLPAQLKTKFFQKSESFLPAHLIYICGLQLTKKNSKTYEEKYKWIDRIYRRFLFVEHIEVFG